MEELTRTVTELCGFLPTTTQTLRVGLIHVCTPFLGGLDTSRSSRRARLLNGDSVDVRGGILDV